MRRPKWTIVLLISIFLAVFDPPFALCYHAPHVLSSRAVTNTSKAGMGWTNGNGVNIRQYESSKVSWYYTWSPLSINTDLEFVPMLWGYPQVNSFSASIEQTLSPGNKVTAVLGMNEPQQSGQSNLTAQQGAAMWKTYLEPLKAQGVRLGSPAPSSAPDGKTWLIDFLSACAGGCTVDFIALHWYATNATEFISYLVDFHTTFMRPLWVTEWACQNFVDLSPAAQCSQADVSAFMNVTQQFMDSTAWVERYAWFGAMKNLQGVNEANALMDQAGNINNLGRQYIGVNGPGATVNASDRTISHMSSTLVVVALLLIVGAVIPA